jgi:hypothetical protein
MAKRRKTTKELKERLSALLGADDFRAALQDLRELPRLPVLRCLHAFLSEGQEKRRWRAVSAIGMLVSDLARENREEARERMRRLMWSLNDESGSIGWGAPEAMAEIMAAEEGLAEEYAHILVSYMRQDGNYLEHPLLQRGLLWGVGRLAGQRPSVMERHGAAGHLPPFLESTDRVVRGLAVWCAGNLGAHQARPRLEALLGEETEIVLYLDFHLSHRRTGELAKEALARLDARSKC